MSKKINGKQSVEVIIDKNHTYGKGTWFFCHDGFQSTGVGVSVEQFDMLKELVNSPDVVEFYKTLRSA